MDSDTWELIEEMKSILEDLVGGEDECRFDHHGHCQTHNLQERERCWYFRSKQVLAKIERRMQG